MRGVVLGQVIAGLKGAFVGFMCPAILGIGSHSTPPSPHMLWHYILLGLRFKVWGLRRGDLH